MIAVSSILLMFQARFTDDGYNIEVVRGDVLHVLDETVQPVHASLWLRTGGVH